MKSTSKILIVFALMCVSALAAYSQDCNNYMKLAAELVSQKKYCDALTFYKKYKDCNSDVDVSTEIALCERYCKLDGGTIETTGKTEQYNPTQTSKPSARDIITLKSGEDIQASVLEIGDIDIKYKKFDNLTSPSYTLKKSEIFRIRYANGIIDVFADLSNPTPIDKQLQTPINQQDNLYGNSNNSYRPEQELLIFKYSSGNQISPYGSKKSPFLAGFLSFLIPGVGQFYNGDVGAGFVYLGINILCSAIWMNSDNAYVRIITQSCALGNNITSMTTAYYDAKTVNTARGYYIGKNAYLNIQPTRLKQNNLLTTGRNYTYGMSLFLNFKD